ncbi:MAG TPA: dethiobiotin synthase [Bacteroidetes bacterium]|nr:dethiobiotin synthase [Bacteroidota bacterium]
MKINNYVDISTIDKEAKKDYIDRHSPFIYCDEKMEKGKKSLIKVQVGKEYSHPDDFDHYIDKVELYDGERLLAEAHVPAGTLGNKSEQLEVYFSVVPMKKMRLSALAYCTKHGVWQSEETKVEVV